MSRKILEYAMRKSSKNTKKSFYDFSKSFNFTKIVVNVKFLLLNIIFVGMTVRPKFQ